MNIWYDYSTRPHCLTTLLQTKGPTPEGLPALSGKDYMIPATDAVFVLDVTKHWFSCQENVDAALELVLKLKAKRC